MTLLVVRHADAKSREKWDEPDHLRPLTKRGVAQAEGLVEVLAPWKVVRIFTSPFVRCVQTVGPLAAAAGVGIDRAAALAEGDDTEARAMVRALATDPAVVADDQAVVLCSHGDIIPAVLNALAHEEGLDLGAFPRCSKGSTWALSAEDGRYVLARYFPPPPTDQAG